MSGFGLKKALNLSNKQQVNEVKTEYFDYIFLGDHFLIPKLFKQIRSKNPHAKIILVSGNNFFNRDYVEQEAERCVNNPCSEIESSYFQNLANLGINQQKINAPLFYKDSKFHPFGGRVKSFELKGKEKRFKNKYSYLDFDEWIQFEDLDQQIDEINKIRKYDYPEEIEFITPTDLIDQANVRIKLKSQSIIEGKNIINFENPKSLEKLIKTDDKSLSMIEFLALIKAESYISLLHEVSPEVKVEGVELENAFYLLPQSTVYENGHYLMLFKKSLLLSYFFIDEDLLVNEEDIAKKIRHFKGVLNRVFPGLKEELKNEKIFVNHNSYYSIDETEKLKQSIQAYSYFYNFINLDLVQEESSKFENHFFSELSRFVLSLGDDASLNDLSNSNEPHSELDETEVKDPEDEQQKNCILGEMNNNIEESLST